MNRNKCEFRLDEINFMGHRVTSDGLKPDERKIEAILKMDNPTDVKGIQRLQGTVGYLSKFLPGLFRAMEPIRGLIQPNVPWKWTKEQDEAMTQVKTLTTESPVPVMLMKEDWEVHSFRMGNPFGMQVVRLPAQKLDMLKSRKNVWPLCSRWNISISIRFGEEQSYTVITSHRK